MSTPKSLTRAEEQIMQVLWKLERSFLKGIVEAMPAPAPHQNTVATILRILIEKKFVGIEVQGRQHEYFPLVSKEQYSKSSIKNLVKSYFNGSFNQAISFMVKEKNISVEDLELLLKELKKKS